MQFLTEAHIDFMKYRGTFVVVSLLLLVVAGVELTFLTGLNLGIDFAGGTQITVGMRDDLEVGAVRRILEAAGLRDAQIQRYGEREDREFLIKAPVVGESEEGSAAALIDALEADLNRDAGGRLDLNQRGTEVLAALLLAEDPDVRRSSDEDAAAAHYEEVAAAIVAARQARSLFRSWDEVGEVADEATLEVLQEKAFLGGFQVLQNENVGPQIGSELRTKGVLAVTLSLLGMLVYIWLRFELRFGIGALVASFHDFLITLGLYAIANYEFNLPTIAAFLTLVGYSVNDTVVIFDRVRENMRRYRRMPLVEVMNVSLNQTLSRTILTSGTTLLAVAALFFFGGEVIRGFAFVMLIGVIVGTYSSVFIACPFTLLWEQYFSGEARERRRSGRTQAA